MTSPLHTNELTTPPASGPLSAVVGRLPNAALGATRVVVSFLFVCHGLVGLFGTFGGVDGQGGTVEPLSWPGWWGSVIHLVAGALVLVGLFTRPAALLCSGSMAYAYFTVHQPIALFPIPNGGEPAALFSWIFLLVGVLGPGAFALDALRRRR
ncbi:DoxX family protein [Actinophytocola xanthii]|uniref:DoxX family protein n=1 Tax=Actinophytocola xanthii TaxID=1912961 RepID=A0A1Q8C5G3_9PSEU|nr:DoxX family protein [Actinophytocola xanthii]OLF09601.1 DoxX family protein [Actinophytocola xanthii]